MIIISFDPSKNTGWSIFDTKRDHSAIQCGVFEMPKGADHYYTSDQLGLKTRALVQDLIKADKRPAFAILEEQSLARIGNSSADAMIYPWVASSSIVSTLANFGVAYGTIPAATWHTMFYGKGFKPPLDNKGKKDWKEAARRACEQMGITIPPQKTINHNAAEACALSICWRGAKLHARRYEPAFMALLQQRNERTASADLFAGAA